MHSKGLPETMQANPQYGDVLFEVFDHLADRIAYATDAGIKVERIITDPGIGFGKNLQHNVTLLHYLAVFHDLGLPILLGASRKRFIGTLTETEVADARIIGSVAAALHGFSQGVQITRVHDTQETRQALNLHLALSETF
jgi:dihydropteroate synthase